MGDFPEVYRKVNPNYFIGPGRSTSSNKPSFLISPGGPTTSVNRCFFSPLVGIIWGRFGWALNLCFCPHVYYSELGTMLCFKYDNLP